MSLPLGSDHVLSMLYCRWKTGIVFLCVLQRKCCMLIKIDAKIRASSDGSRKVTGNFKCALLCLNLRQGYTAFSTRCSICSITVLCGCANPLASGKSCLLFWQILSARPPLKHAGMENLCSLVLFFRTPWCMCKFPSHSLLPEKEH